MSVEAFLPQYTKVWNGQKHRDLIIELLAYVDLRPFDGRVLSLCSPECSWLADLHQEILSGLESVFSDGSEDAQLALIRFYTLLLRMWTARVLSMPEAPWPQPLTLLIKHVFTLTLSILSVHHSYTAINAVLEYLAALGHTMSHATHHPAIRIIYPPPRVVYLLAFLNPTVSALSSLTATLAAFKLAFEASISRSLARRSSIHGNARTSSSQADSPATPTTPTTPLTTIAADYPRPYVNAFNGFLMDMCNLIWRSRAFNTNDTNALGCMLPASVNAALRAYANILNPPQSFTQLFSLSLHPALVALSIATFRALEDAAVEEEEQEARQTNGDDRLGFDDVRVNGHGRPRRGRTITARHAGPVGQKTLSALAQQGGIVVSWADYRLGVLRWLSQMGAGGIEELMFCTMKLLMGNKQPASSGAMTATPTSV